MTKSKPASKLQAWIEARRRFHLSLEQVQMARELGLNPRGFGKLNNRAHEPWKQPLPQFIAQLYYKRFGRTRPEAVVPLEKREGQERAKKAARRFHSDAFVKCPVAALPLRPEGLDDEGQA